MRFHLTFERLETRENPSTVDANVALPPVDPIYVPPMPGPQDPGRGTGNDPTQPPADPISPTGPG